MLESLGVHLKKLFPLLLVTLFLFILLLVLGIYFLIVRDGAGYPLGQLLPIIREGKIIKENSVQIPLGINKSDTSSTKGYRISGLIKKPPFSGDDGLYRVIVEFPSTDGKVKVPVKVVMGRENDNFLVLLAENGVVPKEQVWKPLQLKDFKQMLMKRDQVILYITTEINSSFKERIRKEGCDEKCEFFLRAVGRFGSSTNEALEEEALIDGASAGDLGVVGELIIVKL